MLKMVVIKIQKLETCYIRRSSVKNQYIVYASIFWRFLLLAFYQSITIKMLHKIALHKKAPRSKFAGLFYTSFF